MKTCRVILSIDEMQKLNGYLKLPFLSRGVFESFLLDLSSFINLRMNLSPQKPKRCYVDLEFDSDPFDFSQCMVMHYNADMKAAPIVDGGRVTLLIDSNNFFKKSDLGFLIFDHRLEKLNKYKIGVCKNIPKTWQVGSIPLVSNYEEKAATSGSELALMLKDHENTTSIQQALTLFQKYTSNSLEILKGLLSAGGASDWIAGAKYFDGCTMHNVTLNRSQRLNTFKHPSELSHFIELVHKYSSFIEWYQHKINFKVVPSITRLCEYLNAAAFPVEIGKHQILKDESVIPMQEFRKSFEKDLVAAQNQPEQKAIFSALKYIYELTDPHIFTSLASFDSTPGFFFSHHESTEIMFGVYNRLKPDLDAKPLKPVDPSLGSSGEVQPSVKLKTDVMVPQLNIYVTSPKDERYLISPLGISPAAAAICLEAPVPTVPTPPGETPGQKTPVPQAVSFSQTTKVPQPLSQQSNTSGQLAMASPTQTGPSISPVLLNQTPSLASRAQTVTTPTGAGTQTGVAQEQNPPSAPLQAFSAGKKQVSDCSATESCCVML